MQSVGILARLIALSSSGSEAEKKPSKSAIKKAKEQARLQRKLAARAANKARAASKSPIQTEDSRETSAEPSTPADQPALLSTDAATLTAKAGEPRPTLVQNPAQPPPSKPANGNSRGVQEDVTPSDDTVLASIETSEPSAVSQPPPSETVAPVPDTKPKSPVVDVSHEEVLASISKPTNGHAVVSTPPTAQPQGSAQIGEKAAKRQSFLTRTLWTFIMIGGFLGMSISITLRGHSNIFALRPTAHGSRIHDRARHAMPNTRLPRGDITVLFEAE